MATSENEKLLNQAEVDLVHFGSTIVHLIEHIETGNQLDLDSAVALLSMPNVLERMEKLKSAAMLPVPRSPLKTI